MIGYVLQAIFGILLEDIVDFGEYGDSHSNDSKSYGFDP